MKKTTRRWLQGLVIVGLLGGSSPSQAEPARTETIVEISSWAFWLELLRPVYELWAQPVTVTSDDEANVAGVALRDDLQRAVTMDPDG